MMITIADARARAEIFRAAALALTNGADKAEAAGQADFDTVDALAAEAHASSDELQAVLDGK